MKRFILLPGMALLILAQTRAQNVFPASGNVGIGTTTPAQALSVQLGNIQLANGSGGTNGNLYLGGITHNGQPGLRLFGGLVNGSIPAGFIDVHTTDLNDGLRIRVDNSSGGTERMRITAAGNVIIGNVTTPAGYKLFVEQGILTEKVKVAVKTGADWADHVFAENYKLMPLEQVAQYIQRHKHLPGIPAAEKLVQEGGIDVNNMFALQMAKIEELTLYLIELQRKLNTVATENEQLKTTIASLQKQ